MDIYEEIKETRKNICVQEKEEKSKNHQLEKQENKQNVSKAKPCMQETR